MGKISNIEQLRKIYIELVNAQCEDIHELTWYFNKDIGNEFGVSLSVNTADSSYRMKSGIKQYSLGWLNGVAVNHIIEDVVRGLQSLCEFDIEGVYNTPTLIEKIKENIEQKYEVFTFSEDYEGKTITLFDNEYEAKEFCFECGWSYKDKYGRIWGLNYRKILVEKEDIGFDLKNGQVKETLGDESSKEGLSHEVERYLSLENKSIITSREFEVYIESGQGCTQPLVSFETEKDAIKFCEDNRWCFKDPNGFVWDMDYEEVEVERENIALDEMISSAENKREKGLAKAPLERAYAKS